MLNFIMALPMFRLATRLKLMLVAKGYYSNHEYLNFANTQHENFNQNTPSNLHIKFFNANRIFIKVVDGHIISSYCRKMKIFN